MLIEEINHTQVKNHLLIWSNSFTVDLFECDVNAAAYGDPCAANPLNHNLSSNFQAWLLSKYAKICLTLTAYAYRTNLIDERSEKFSQPKK